MSTAAYLRVSSDKQEAARQREAIDQFASVDYWYVDDQGRNPRDLPDKRPQFQKLLKAVERGLITRIVVDRQDRFGVRDSYQFGKYIDFLRQHKCELYDAAGACLSGDDDVSILTGTLGALTSRREQKEKGHRSVTAKLRLAKAGEYQGGYPPYGLDVVCIGDKEKWRVVFTGHFEREKVYPDGRRERFDGKGNFPAKDVEDTLRLRPSMEADRISTVRQIFDWYATEVISPGTIATRLNKLGVPAVFGKWNKQKIGKLLENPAYIGLPAWNKRGASRFVEFVDGRIQDAKGKTGRQRSQSDYAQPIEQEFEPLVPIETWRRVQEKRASSRTGTSGRPQNTAELWLRPFLYCGRCGKPMHATRGGNGQRVFPSYFCGSYNQFGKDNPTGCRCHRVKHERIEAFVLRYLEDVAPDVARLLAQVDVGSLDLPEQDLFELLRTYQGIACDIVEFVQAPRCAEFRDIIRNAKTLPDAYALVYDLVLPAIKSEIAEREAALDKLLADYCGLPESVRAQANRRLDKVGRELKYLKMQAIDLRQPFASLREDIQRQQEALENARNTVVRDVEGRKKTEALRGVVDKVICHFDHDPGEVKVGRNGHKISPKSRLAAIEITAVNGSSYSTASPGPD